MSFDEEESDGPHKGDTLKPRGAPVPPPFSAEAGSGHRASIVVLSGDGCRAVRASRGLARTIPGPGLFRAEATPLDPRLSDRLFRPKPSRAPEPPSRVVSAPSDTDVPSLGTIVDKYRLDELLGIGGFGAVFRATHLLLRTVVAVKLLRRSVLRQRPELAQRLCEEARHVARINHPNVVRVIDVTHSKEITFFVMEYIDGQTLAQRVTNTGPLAPVRVLELALDVASGLKAGLDQGVVHRDIKPANIILSGTGRAKIVDLGLAASSEMGGVGRASAFGSVGTPGYMAPEVVSTGHGDFRSDMFSLGVTLHFALTGGLPRLGASGRLEPALARRVPELGDLMLCLLAPEPRLRPRSYGELIETAERARAALGIGPNRKDST